MYETAASCKDIARAPITNWEPQCVMLVGYSYAVRHGMKVQLVTPYRVSHLQSKAGDTLSSRHVSSYDVNACSWDMRGDLTLNSMVQIHTSVTLLTSRDLAWSSGRLTCQHASQISAVAHVS